jgi:hypothetical protein
VESLGRKLSLFISAIGMGTLFFIIGSILKTHPPPTPIPGQTVNPPPASQAMAGMLYIYVCFYSMGWGESTFLSRIYLFSTPILFYLGPLPWVYVSDIFPTRTRHYGLALASSSQWLWSKSLYASRAGMDNELFCYPDFVVSKVTPQMITNLGYKIFLMFATINIVAMGIFSL